MRGTHSFRPSMRISTPVLAALALASLLPAQGIPYLAPATASPVADRDACPRVELEGFVFEPDGVPAEGAVVISSAGGRAVTDWSGHYRLDATMPPDATSVQVTAIGRGNANLAASTRVPLVATSGLARVDPLFLARGTSCEPSWIPTFGGGSGMILSLAVFDDGGGPALYAGGHFKVAGDAVVNRIAKWDGSSWSALGGGTNGPVHALAVFDDGNGPALYAGGQFSSAGGVVANRIARWDGSSWAAVAGGVSGSPYDVVYALAVHDDGSGTALYVGGDFTLGGGAVGNRIARWDGSSWTTLGSGLDRIVHALAVHDDGGGPELYVGGTFAVAGGVAANRVAKWDGSSWSALGSGFTWTVFALSSFDPGGGSQLYAGGTTAVSRWNGSVWTSVGNAIGVVHALGVYDDGGGPEIYAGGNSFGVRRWTGSSWVPVGSGSGIVQAFAVFDAGSGLALHVGGSITTQGGVSVKNVAGWDGASWAALGAGTSGHGLGSSADAFAAFEGDGGPALYAACQRRVMRSDGAGRTFLGSDMDHEVTALAMFDDGGGPALHAAGWFTTAGGVPANRVARWGGSGWAPLGSGINGTVLALTVFDDGGGPALYAGGFFSTAGGSPTSNIARWDGSGWTSLDGGTSGSVITLAVFDDGSGAALYAGGIFTSAGGSPASRIARWDGSSWSALGAGLGDGPVMPSVRALAVFDDGGGPALYAGGFFTTAGGVPASRVAKWDGSSWSALGSGVGDGVYALTVFDDGDGPALHAGGDFFSAGGVAANRIAKWDGSSWTPLGSGMSSGIRALGVFGSALYAGGGFTAFDSGDDNLASWGCDTLPPTLFCPPVVASEPLDGAPGEIVTFSVTAFDDHDTTPDIVCAPPSGSFFPAGSTLVTCTATDDYGNQSTCQFEVTVRLRVQKRKL